MILGPSDPRALHLSPERKQILRKNFLEGLDTATQTCQTDTTHTQQEEATVPDNNPDIPPSASEVAEIHILADGARGGWIVEVLYADDEGDWQTTDYHFDHLQYAADLVRSIGGAS